METAVLVPVAEWQRLQKDARPSLKALLLAPEGHGDVNVPARGRMGRRPPVEFD